MMPPTEIIAAVFVYGTLKRGQCREACWPRTPQRVDKAWTSGELYDLGPYPALISGSDLVAGQLWRFDLSDMGLVIARLDEVEEYFPGREATNLYNRVIVDCSDQWGSSHRAFTYHYAQSLALPGIRRIDPAYVWDERRFAVWPIDDDW